MSESNATSDTSSDTDSVTDSDFSSTAAQDLESAGYIVEDPRSTFPREISIDVPQVHQIETNNDRRILAQSADLMNSRNREIKITRPLVYTEGAVHTIPLVVGIHLIPGEIMPFAPPFNSIQFVLELSLTRLPFGVSHKINKDYRSFGTIATISFTTENRQIAVIGHQRFEILEISGQRQQLKEIFNNQTSARAQIKIIKDTTLFNPLNKLCLYPKQHNMGHSKMWSKRDMFQTQWPSWVYKQFDIHGLASHISKKVKMICKDIEVSEDPIFLSFQLTKLGIFSERQVSELLGIELTNLRLQRELQYLNNLVTNNVIIEYICDGPNCGARVCSVKDMISMSITKLHGSYCKLLPKNLKIITVLNLDDNLSVLTLHTTGCKCFPGYQSTSIYCRACHNPLGWKFVVDCNMQLTPILFYALSVTTLKMMLVKTDL